MAIQKILCCCGSGLGSSLMVEMNVQDVLKDLGVDGVEVEHSTVSDVMPGAADLFIVGRDLGDFIAGIPDNEKVVLDNILDKEELKAKLSEKFGV
ncbi:PTS sugar transporter subunit IIB [Lancefieldella rimae]